MIKILLPLLFSVNAFGAFSAGTQWEIRSGSVANNAAGCGFDSSYGGTDQTQSTSVAWSGIDLVSANGTTNPCVVSSASHSFVTADKGNTIAILSGTSWIKGWYQIQNVNTVNGTATLDRACASAASVSSGTFAGPASCGLGSSTASFTDDALFEMGVPGNTYWVLKGNYTPTSIAIAAAGTALLPITIRGYKTTHAATDIPTGVDLPYWALTSASTLTTGANWRINNLWVYGNPTTATVVAGSNTALVNVKAVNYNMTATSRSGISLSAGATCVACEGVSYRGFGINATGSTGIIGSYAHSSRIGVLVGSTQSQAVIDSILAGNSESAVTVSGAAVTVPIFIHNNTLYGGENKTGTGLDSTQFSGTSGLRFANNIVYGFANGVSHPDVQTTNYDDGNAYFNNTTNFDATKWALGPHSISGTNPTFPATLAQKTGSTATISGTTFTDTNATFTTSPAVVAGRDYLYIKSGTAGPTFAMYGIVSVDSATQLTLDVAPGNSATADHVWQINIGNDFSIGTNLRALAYPSVFPGSASGGTTTYKDIGSTQRRERAGTTGSSH